MTAVVIQPKEAFSHLAAARILRLPLDWDPKMGRRQVLVRMGEFGVPVAVLAGDPAGVVEWVDLAVSGQEASLGEWVFLKEAAS